MPAKPPHTMRRVASVTVGAAPLFFLVFLVAREEEERTTVLVVAVVVVVAVEVVVMMLFYGCANVVGVCWSQERWLQKSHGCSSNRYRPKKKGNQLSTIKPNAVSDLIGRQQHLSTVGR